jgi:alpha-beta hydrolase superfamily lysophospholipase
MLCAASLLLAVAGSPPPTPASAPAPDAFEMTIGGESYGVEEFRRTESADGVTISGKLSFTFPGGGTGALTQEARLARDGHPVTYTLDIDVPGQQLVLAARRTDAGYSMTITPKGATEPAQSRTTAAKEDVFLLDNNLASHLDALTRGLRDLGVGGERNIRALVPQVLQSFPAGVKRGPDGKALVGGAVVATRSYSILMASTATELVVRADDGALLQASVPVQRAILKRRGFEPASEAPVAAAGGFLPDPREQSIELAGSAGPLPATLLVPKAEQPVPAVILLSGSGPNDRDETIGPNKPFADIARALADRGIASLRFDKRTFVIKDKSRLADVRLHDEYDDDAKVAIASAAAAAGIDPKRIFVIGHSEGAMVAPRVAAASPATRGIVMMAPGVRPVDAMIIDQMASGAKAAGLGADDIAGQIAMLKETFAAIRDPKRKDPPPFMGASAAYWRELMSLDVAKMVRESKLPILVLQGDEDIQVRKDADFELLKSRVGSSGGRVTYLSFPGLNHLFMKVDRESTGAEYGISGHVDPAVIAAIAEWVLLR